jgi:hypothetical protein
MRQESQLKNVMNLVPPRRPQQGQALRLLQVVEAVVVGLAAS